MSSRTKKNTWTLILKVIITVATAVAGALGPERLYLMISENHHPDYYPLLRHPEAEAGFETCRRDHIRHRGFTDMGYHFYITRDGEIHRGRPLEKVGAHCKNHNRHSIGICYEGGLSADCTPADTAYSDAEGKYAGTVARAAPPVPQSVDSGTSRLESREAVPLF